MKRSVLACLALVACAGPSSEAISPEVPAGPGDPAFYAPPGWPLAIGDRITVKRLVELRSDFPNRIGDAEHVVGDTVYSANWYAHKGALPGEDPEFIPVSEDWSHPFPGHDEGFHLVYAGHYAAPDRAWGSGIRRGGSTATVPGRILFGAISTPERIAIIFGVPERAEEIRWAVMQPLSGTRKDSK